tara:strand:+ start:453 stop:677 length:225 start_codon:yes stop_codon:yes gene_type:complete
MGLSETYNFSGFYKDEKSHPTENKVTKSITTADLEKAKKIFQDDYADGIELHTITDTSGSVLWKKQEVKNAGSN